MYFILVEGLGDAPTRPAAPNAGDPDGSVFRALGIAPGSDGPRTRGPTDPDFQ